MAAGSANFTLTANGGDFVPNSIVRWNGTDRVTTFISSDELQAAISAADVATAGSASITVFSPLPGGGTSLQQTFTIDPPPVGNPVPAIDTLSPRDTTAGSGDFTLTVIGNNFVPETLILLDGEPLPTTYTSSQSLQAQVSAAQVSNDGRLTVTAVTGAPGGGTSSPSPFFVLDANSGYFFDDFNTANSPDIGNGWTEKSPFVFSIENNTVVGIETTLDTVYRDSIVYRPVQEDLRDVRVSIEFVRRADDGMAQVHARTRRSTINIDNILESYILYVNDFARYPGAFAIAIGPETPHDECNISRTDFSSPLIDGERYRLTLEVIGDLPVQLNGELAWFVGG
ncbi:MAG: IPT/TIG domain-containing protein, partial [Thiotrichales bacterium]|nr:IPT/TIG domain-containing protein [Thiotrichales bacterium]